MRSAGDSRPTGGRGADRASRTIWASCLTKAAPLCGPSWIALERELRPSEETVARPEAGPPTAPEPQTAPNPSTIAEAPTIAPGPQPTSSITLEGHTCVVTSVAFSPDGSRLASASTEDHALEIEKNLRIQRALNEILLISLAPISLHSQLHQILDLIVHLPWLALESKGCIFLVEGDPPELAMKAQVGMPEACLISCQKVRFGSCLCGRAILANKPIFAGCIDDRHEIHYEGISPHGHYCVPITSGERRVGLLNMYVREGHPFSPVEDEFLRRPPG